MKKTGVFYEASYTCSECIARVIAEKADADLFNVAHNPAGEIDKYQNLILGTSTCYTGHFQDAWHTFLPDLKKADLSGKAIAFFGLGNSSHYPGSFVDGMGMVYEAIKDKGCSFVGFLVSYGFVYKNTRILAAEKFVGLPSGKENKSTSTLKRIEEWIEEIKKEFK